MNKLLQTHKRAIIIILIAIIIIAGAYYFTLGKDLFQNEDKENGSDSASGSNGTSPAKTNSSFPLKVGVYNPTTKVLQQRINLSVTTCQNGSTIKEDGVLGKTTIDAITRFFPNIGKSIAANQSVAESQYNTMVTSKPGC